MRSSVITGAGRKRPEGRTENAVMRITKDPYFDWLCISVGLDKRLPGANYIRLAQELHQMEFRAKLPADANRGMDGMQLRVDFMRMHGDYGTATNRGGCTMLELMVALSKRMNFLMDGNEKRHRTAYYFYTLLRNVGLDKVTDDRWDMMHGEFFTDDAVYRIIDRQYEANGRGGFFPLKYPKEDQRGVELWYQMQAWLNENSDMELDF